MNHADKVQMYWMKKQRIPTKEIAKAYGVSHQVAQKAILSIKKKYK